MIGEFDTYLSKYRTGSLRCLYVLWTILLLSYCAFKGYIFTPYYEEWQISDWLINYEGGFVRRGLLGQILYECYQLHPYPIYYVIMALSAFSTLLLVWLTIRFFLKEGWSLAILPFPFMFAYSWLNPGWMRRDHWVLLIAIGIFYLYNLCMKERKVLYLILFQLSNIMVILIHEASFFFIVPIVGMHYYLNEQKYFAGKMLVILLRVFLFMFPSLVVMSLACLYKGDANIATVIWNSWYPTMTAYPLANVNPDIGAGVGALTWDTWETFKMHFNVNWCEPFYKFIPSFPFTILNFLAIYYFVTRLNTIDFKWNVLKNYDRIRMSNILLSQWIFMFPLFTVLSCDYGRTLPYWVLSSLFLFHLLEVNWCFPQWLTNFSVCCQRGMDNIGLLRNPWFYLFALLCMPISSIGGASLKCFMGQSIIIIKKIVALIL